MLLETLELSRGEQDTLSVESTTELLGGEVALPETIVILEELEEPDSILLDDLLDLSHELLVRALTIEVSEAVDVGSLGTGSGSVDHILEAVSITQELCVLDVVVLIAVDGRNSGGLGLVNLESEGVEDLAEDLGGDLEGAESVSVLEEALRIETVPADHFAERLNNLAHGLAFRLIRGLSAVDSLGADLTNRVVDGLLETLGGEDFIDGVRESSPADMSALFGSLEVLSQLLEFTLRDGALGHGEADAELRGSDVARSQSVEITEELSNADALLLAPLADASDNIIDVIRRVADNLGLAGASLSLGVVVGAVVEALADAEELITTVDILTEVDIVALIDVAHVHVASEETLEDVLRGTDPEEVEHTEELLLGHVSVASPVIVLEHRLQVDALVLDLSAVLVENVLNLLVQGSTSQVLSAGQKCVILGDGRDASGGGLVDALDRERQVHVLAELSVPEEALRVISLILLGQSLELIVGEGEVHR